MKSGTLWESFEALPNCWAACRGTNETQAKLSGLIVEESSRLNNIVTEFLDFARPQTPHFQVCDLNEILDKNMQFLQPELEIKGISLQDDLPHRPLPIRADPQLLYRSFLNIFMNAIQAIEGAGDPFGQRVGGEKDHYQITIEDDGNGNLRKRSEKDFRPFFQYQGQRKRPGTFHCPQYHGRPSRPHMD